MTQDVKQFSSLTKAEQDAFLKIIGLLATLDGPQTVIAMKIADFTTDPSVKSLLRQLQIKKVNIITAMPMFFICHELDKQMEAFEMGRTDEVLNAPK